jgi:hypothetical protein
LIAAPLGTEEGAALGRMFDQVFESLWEAQDSESAEGMAGI